MTRLGVFSESEIKTIHDALKYFYREYWLSENRKTTKEILEKGYLFMTAPNILWLLEELEEREQKN